MCRPARVSACPFFTTISSAGNSAGACGFCFNCARGYTNAGLTTNLQGHGGDPVEQILDLRAPHRHNVQELREGSGRKMQGLSIEMGQAPVKRYNVYLRDLILSGIAKPSFFVSHRLPLEAAPDAYEKFDKREDGYRKVLLKPNRKAA